MTSTGPSSGNAVRVVNQNSCGSGSKVGNIDGDSLIMTNAHVAGTRLGRVVTIDTQAHGRMQGTVIEAFYSDRTLTDWALVRVPGWQEMKPVKMSVKDPPGTSGYTRGSPRCVWPLKSTDITTVDIDDDSPLWRWTPDAIGGQSGSGVWLDADNLQYGLLTWTWGGYGAGQMTSWIYRQARTRSLVAPFRIPGLEEVPGDEDEESVDRTGCDDPVVEVGVFAATSLHDYDIWHVEDDEPEPPVPPDDDKFVSKELFAEYLRAHTKLITDFNEAWIKRLETDDTDSSEWF